MAKPTQRRPRRDWRRIVLYTISVLIILSMALGLALTFASPPTG